jgi:hypothetical protein
MHLRCADAALTLRVRDRHSLWPDARCGMVRHMDMHIAGVSMSGETCSETQLLRCLAQHVDETRHSSIGAVMANC